MAKLPRWEVRILVAIPALFVLVALVTTTMAIELTLAAVGSVELTAGQSVAIQKVRLGLISLTSVVALGLGIVLAAAIVRPLRQMVTTLRARLEPAPARRAVSEISELSNQFNHMLLSFDKFVSDSHIVEGMPFGVVLVGGDGRIRRSNAEARRLLHAGAEALEGRRVDEVGGPTLAAAVTAAMETSRRMEPVEGTAVPVGDVVLPGVDGVTIQVSFAAAERAGEMLLTLRDLSQVPKIRSQIRRVDELAAVGAHVASLAHEVSGSLMALQTLFDLLGTLGTPDADLERKIQDEMDRAARLMEEMRAFGQESLRERTPCHLGEMLEETAWMCQRRFASKGIELEPRIVPDLPVIIGDADRLRQVFVNVVTNAFEATPPGGRVRLTAERDDTDIIVRVANSGSYIPPEDRLKIFDLFFTTRKRGTGFGLAIARRAMRDHGGDITVESSEETGTEFVLHFPSR